MLSILGAVTTRSPPSYFYPYRIHVIEDGEPGEYITDRLTDEAEKFLDANRGSRFLLLLSHYGVHAPFEAKAEITAKYRAKDKPADGQKNPVYAAMIQSVDESVGRVLKKLDDLNLSDNTVVVFMSDNGGVTKIPGIGLRISSNSPLRAGKGTIYEGGIREPMLVRWPGVVTPGSTCEVPVITDDFFPTLCDLAGVPIGPGRAIDGESFVPLLKQTAGLRREALYWHFPHYGLTPPSTAIRKGDYKLIQFHEGSIELYDLKSDLGETRNLAGEMPQKVAELSAMIGDWLKKMDAWTAIPNPNYDPAATPPPPSAQRLEMLRQRAKDWF